MTTLVLLALSFAPAPKVRPPVAPAIKAGSYSMTWSATDSPAWFDADGSYRCLWHGGWWHGGWSQVDGVLTVEEWPADEPGRRHRWTIRLKCPQTGDGPSPGTPWRLGIPPVGAGGGA